MIDLKNDEKLGLSRFPNILLKKKMEEKVPWRMVNDNLKDTKR